MARVGAFGADNINWRGDSVSIAGGNQRAQRAYPGTRLCSVDGCRSVAERHHRDGDTRNNEIENIEFLCNRHHKAVDGRMTRPAFRAAWRRAMVGVPLSHQHRARISAGLLGRSVSEETRAKLSIAQKAHQSSKPTPTHCAHGHAFTDGNLTILKNGCRWCKECGRIRGRRDYHAKKQAMR